MTYLQLFYKLQTLPPAYQAEVEEFIAFLQEKNANQPHSKRKTPVFGSAKGQFQMSDDFDAPLNDFADYM
ncbi:type II toxin-antitoxin system VapB family antitoxin [Spirosoma koreense]